MPSKSTLRTPYDVRVNLVEETLKKNSSLDEDAAHKLAVEVLRALNSIPETIR
ncbi:DUF6307 family protein [Mycobacterium camsae]|uniref:DUF6307 family protein n=1 Tax=Mycobacterium gordonae TaxID=1778 RepID=UPI001F11D999|nr:DUF6307 family protein [Mycobacterium gordonae]